MNPEQNGGQFPPIQNPQQPQAPTPDGGTSYDFILNPQKPSRPRPSITGNSSLERVLVVVGGLIILVVLGVILSTVLTSGTKEKTAGLLSVAERQTELIRIASAGTKHTTSVTAQGLAQNVQASITSDSIALVAYMKNNGQKVTPAQLALKQSKTADATLASAQENNTYDTAFRSIIQTDLDEYMAALQTAYTANPGPKGRALLQKQYDAATLLKTASEQK